ncbi:hypothetical protein [Thermus thermophilus]|uniref:hypothetical protein n=1 Tax=Thermus thermophilus TaxID=274 RepID=UPI001C74E214|nr:hypothetical protein [Thermus thermophilus]BCZ90722.1 hypothetical protein TthAA22_25270 [Thermus thermophilus]
MPRGENLKRLPPARRYAGDPEGLREALEWLDWLARLPGWVLRLPALIWRP